MRGIDEFIPGLDVLAPPILPQLPTHKGALGVENRQAGTDFVGETEQVQLDAELAVVAALSLFDQLEVAVQRLLRLPGGAVDALQAGVFLVAAPVGRRTASELERRDVLGRRDGSSARTVGPDPFPAAGIEGRGGFTRADGAPVVTDPATSRCYVRPSGLGAPIPTGPGGNSRGAACAITR